MGSIRKPIGLIYCILNTNRLELASTNIQPLTMYAV